MKEESIFCEVGSDDPDRFDYVPCETELAQVLHHATVFSKSNCLQAVGNSKRIMSCTKMNFTQELLEAYLKTLQLLFDLCLKPFYVQGNEQKDLAADEEFMAHIEHAVDQNRETVVDMRTFQSNARIGRREWPERRSRIR